MKKASFYIISACTCLMISCIGSKPMVTDQAYHEPKKEDFNPYQNAIGFYDTDAEGNPRKVRNDLSGDLAGMVQFVQSHSVNPRDNEDMHMPRLAGEREALLLFTPDPTSDAPQSILVSVLNNGVEAFTLEIRHPHRLFDSDRDQVDERPDIVYSKRAWSAVLPWHVIRPGLSLEFTDHNGSSGLLASEAIDMAPPAEIVIHNIRLGLLTDPPVSDDHLMLLDPEKAGTDYFQTVPVAEMIIARYEDVKLDRVMVSTGAIYDIASEDEGGVYSGDMREDVGKSTFSVGINLANWGITSSGMRSQHQPQLTQTVITHHAQGMYSNGEQLHGLSGGNGMLTLIRSVGNEFSHEIGHHYGLGHYPGRDGDNDFWTTHHHDSGWGYIGHRQRMRANIHWNATELSDTEATGVPNFKDMYRFTRDAMSGGDNASQLSLYTHYTGYSTQIRIQPSLNRAVFAEDSPTGYRNWNKETGRMDVYSPQVPESRFIWFNSEDGYYLAPRRHGVEVYTLLGGYDPIEGVGLLYPPVRGNWGNVFDLPEPGSNSEDRQCWLAVTYTSGAVQKVALAPQRMGSNANKLHVQFAADEGAEKAALYCRNEGKGALRLAETEFPFWEKPIAPPVVIGREAGYEALRAVELKELEQAWLDAKDGENPCDEDNIRILCDTYAGDAAALLEPAQTRFKQFLDKRKAGERLNRWVHAYSNELQNGDAAALEALHRFLQQIGAADGWQQLSPFISSNSKQVLQTIEI
jgi:hypothetical protein